ncbi:NADH dehydrogenase [Tersicoccus phoenicis]|uniref:NADH dehydrogenase n=1 Tax=Tersicoccus phoenicis TaxID=554083 RepID=A0A1R1L7I4_9MICC|nr:NADH dehydrogenase [Tersicoccus phoenicis]
MSQWAALGVPVVLLLVTLVGAAVDGVLAGGSRNAGSGAGGSTAGGSTAGGSTAGRGRAGLTVPLAEAARLLRQRRRGAVAADTLLWRAGVVGMPVAAVLMVAVLPVGSWVVADLPVGLVWFNAIDVCIWAFAWLAGWGANGVPGLVGGYRFLALALAYELPLMFALTAPAAAAGSLRMADIVAAQDGLWFVVWMPVAFVVFCAAVLGFSLHRPFVSPVATDITGGVLGELTGVDRLLFEAGRYGLLTAGSGFGVALFLGGGAGPLLPAWVWFLVKTLVLLVVLLAVRRRLPLIRPDRLMGPAWLVALPVVLLQVLVVAVVVIPKG